MIEFKATEDVQLVKGAGRLRRRFLDLLLSQTHPLYLPLLQRYAAALRSRIANKGASGSQMADWRHNLEQKWGALRFGEMKVETKDQQHVFDVQVYLNDLDPKAVQIELYADGVSGGEPVRQEMKNIRQNNIKSGGYIYGAVVSAARLGG